ncbi:LOW QUALITY PROTEIN: ADP-ribosylation factor-binding protein GGA3a [Nelusetta ayraudi]|uniref:LOW QUALITY PROTEIN: ADP-ribosylation factor-binding protein GGA3a n=1 Tax=Nelusetta ayraudi TaxID=303726 RepID=UPI003F706CF3
MAGDGESLESCLNKATNPSNRQEEWEHMMAFCDQVNKDPEGPQTSLRLLVHKIQSPQEWEALQALTVLETCMKNCGRRFHSEVAKFKFLNELVKVISPKYLGDTLSEKVKTKVIAMLYSWTVSLPDEAKISEAYQMLRSQDDSSVDPEMSLDADTSMPCPRQKNAVFGDEKKNKRLSELLKSKKPGDLQEANRLIKNMVKEDEVRAQKATKQKSTLETVDISVKLLDDMLAHYCPDKSTDGDRELIKELYSECDKLRQTVCQMASESEDNDSSLGDILQASDDLTHAINSYKKMEKELTLIAETESAHQTQPSVAQGTSGGTDQSEVLIDLVGLDVQSNSAPQTSSASALLWGPADPLAPFPKASTAGLSLLDHDLFSLGLGQSVPEKHATALDVPRKQLVFQCALQYGWVHTRICAWSRSLSADPPLPGFVQFCRCRTKSPCNLSLRRAAFDLSCLVSHCDPQPRHREAIEPHHVAHNHTALTLRAALFACVAHRIWCKFSPILTGIKYFYQYEVQISFILFQELGHFDLSPPLVSAHSASLPESSSTAPCALNCLGPVFSTRPVFTGSDQTARVTFPQSPTSVPSSTLSSVLAQSFSLSSIPPPQVLAVSVPPASSAPPAHHLQNLDFLDAKSYSHSLPVQSDDLLRPAAPSPTHGSNSNPPISLLLDDMQRESVASSTNSLVDGTSVPLSLFPALPPTMGQDGSLANVFVPLDAIKPSQVCPVTAYDKNGIRVLLHWAANSPAGRPDVQVMVASMLSTAPLLVKDIVLQAAVPKMMKVRLQQPSGTELTPFNPILPPASITQVVLLANPFEEKIRMRFKLSFTLGERSYTEVGEVTEFPPTHTLGAL